jgi:hypothetical protein
MSDEIERILGENRVSDLRRFIGRRQCLNETNAWLVYLFHLVQTGGILTTAVAQGYGMKDLVWLGVGLNFLASLLQIFEQTNNNMSKKMLDNIMSIKNGTYVDEGVLVETGDKKPAAAGQSNSKQEEPKEDVVISTAPTSARQADMV